MTGRPQQESNLAKGLKSESAFNHAVINVNDAQNMVEGHSQQTKRNRVVREMGRIGENLINREFA